MWAFDNDQRPKENSLTLVATTSSRAMEMRVVCVCFLYNQKKRVSGGISGITDAHPSMPKLST